MTVVAEGLQVGVGVGATVLQPDDVIYLDGFGDMAVPQAFRAERMMS
ncbi:hypothetical protein SB861_03340 [Paraburkholderia sp. SIMBA_049]